MSSEEEEAKLERFLQWLQVNGVELRGCQIKYCNESKGFGIFTSDHHNSSDGVLLVVPLHLALTPMRVLQDPLIGPECRAMFEQGEVDDRFLMVLFLMLERLRNNSSWKPYLDLLPTSFGNPLWFSDHEFSELKGTTLYRASLLQKKSLSSLYEDKVKNLVKKLLAMDGDLERANSVFWTRALNIPLPHSFVFPQNQDDQDVSEVALHSESNGITSSSGQGETIWVEGLVPGIDFCNHDLKAAATWEVDGTGSVTGVPSSMYLLSVGPSFLKIGKEISISYGDKGNEELLYLYGFVIDDNPDDYLMIHYPVEAIQTLPFSDSKAQLLEAQKAGLRCLLPKRLLDQGFFPLHSRDNGKENSNGTVDKPSSYSWSGQRRIPSYVDKLVFPEEFLSALRTIAMQEDQLYKVSSLLEELVGSDGERQPSDTEVKAAVWEACGDSGAFQLLVDLLQSKMMELEENSGTEDADSDLLNDVQVCDVLPCKISKEAAQEKLISRNRWSCIVYRRGQKQLTKLFLKEAEHALQLALSEGN
ncbi:hypothetical protein ACFE04_026459 [Oxalis oulophora]